MSTPIYNNIPQTIARIAPSIRICYQLQTGPVTEIGAVIEMSRDIDRSIYRRYELNHDIPGRAVELIPGPITGITLTIRRAVLYTGTLLEATGFDNAEDLAMQNIPINIIEERYNPNDNEMKIKQTVKYIGCYFISNPFTINVERDWQIIQDCRLAVSYIDTVNHK